MSVCALCGTSFACGMVDGDASAPCWCTQLPPLPMPVAGRESPAQCYCPDCLARLTQPAACGPREGGQ